MQVYFDERLVGNLQVPYNPNQDYIVIASEVALLPWSACAPTDKIDYLQVPIKWRSISIPRIQLECGRHVLENYRIVHDIPDEHVVADKNVKRQTLELTWPIVCPGDLAAYERIFDLSEFEPL